MSRRPLIAALAIAASLAVAVPTAGAAPARPLVLGTADPGYASSDAAHRDRVYDATVDAKAGVVRISAFWFAIAPDRAPAAALRTDPRNAAYDFERLDAAVRDAKSRGLEVILTLQRAPNWAEGTDEPAGLAQGVWKPDPVAFGDFAAGGRHPLLRRIRAQPPAARASSSPASATTRRGTRPTSATT